VNDSSRSLVAADGIADAIAVDAAPSWELPPARQMLTWPAPHMVWRDRVLFRSLAAIAVRHVRTVNGIENIHTDCDPFILAPNHSTWRESVLVPSLLVILRGGKLIHFLADWNFRLIPGLGAIYRRGQVVNVAWKDARPKALNLLRRFYDDGLSPFEHARRHLAAGRPVGIFPEGTVNKDPRRLLTGRVGMARLSLETGVPVVPLGIGFPGIDLDRPIPETAIMDLNIGAPLHPPRLSAAPTAGDVRRWHTTVMTEIAQLSGKTWGR
jgi:1-acyl-sn-glycerol-3-phosphate acyltransferase